MCGEGIGYPLQYSWASFVGDPPAMQGLQSQTLLSGFHSQFNICEALEQS